MVHAGSALRKNYFNFPFPLVEDLGENNSGELSRRVRCGGVLLNLKQSQSDGNCSHSSKCSAQTKLSVRPWTCTHESWKMVLGSKYFLLGSSYLLSTFLPPNWMLFLRVEGFVSCNLEIWLLVYLSSAKPSTTAAKPKFLYWTFLSLKA